VEPAVIVPEPGQATERLRRLEYLQEVCRVVSSSRDLDQVLSFICRAVRHAFDCKCVAIYRLDPRGQRIVGPMAVDPAASPPGELMEGLPEVSSLELRRGASAAADVALGLMPYHLSNCASRSTVRESRAGERTGQTAAIAPLRARGQIRGLMLVTSETRGPRVSDDQIEALRPFTEQAGLAIEQAQFSAESERRVEFLSALLQISTSLTSHSELSELLQGACDRLLEVSELELTAVFLTEGAGQTLRLHTSAGVRPPAQAFYEPFRIGERLAGRAALERLVIVTRNIQQDRNPATVMAREIGMRTVVCAPLLLRGQLLGVLAAGTLRDMELSSEETDLIAAVANQLAAAIANVRLLEETRERMEEHRRRRDELTVLYGISRAVVGTIGLEERLRVIAEGLTEATRTTRCAIFRLDRDGLLPWISYGDTPEEKRRFQALDIAPLDATRLLRAMSARKPPVVMRSPDQRPFAQVPWLQDWGVRSALWLPLAFQNRLTGLAMVYQPGEERSFLPEQVELAAAVANQAAIAIRVSQAYEHERNLAETLQRSFMPSVGARLRHFDLGQSYHPALKEADVGGDFFDVFRVPDGRVALVMADVSGKGLPAAMQTAMVKYMLRAYAVEEPTPAQVLERLNRGLCSFIDPDLFVSAFYGLLCAESGEMQYGNAGHESPLLALKEHGYCTSLDVTGPVLGLDRAVSYFNRNVCLQPGDVLLMYTDGVTNARRGGELFGRDRLEALLPGLASRRAGRIVSHIYRTVRAFAEGDLHDDCALLALKAKEVWKHPVQP
jgi:serine phosphatase RsbU (regulator of sigma subunit)